MRPGHGRTARRALDRRLADIDASALTVPAGGWIRAVRVALGMRAQDLAARLGVTQSAISRLEESEMSGGIRLASLQRVAEAMQCRLVYALVPARSLHDIAVDQAHVVARKELGAVEHSMRLEDQGLDADKSEERLDDYAEELLRSRRDLWRQG